MPMQMCTVVPAGGAGLSVGQKQRLLIARAFARRLRVLLFDEATRCLFWYSRNSHPVTAIRRGKFITRM